MIRHVPFAVLVTFVGCAWVNRVDPANVPQPGHACANEQHQCGPRRGCCLDDDETCCGLPESVGCGDAKTGCLFIGNSLGGTRGEPQIRPEREPLWICRGSQDPAHVPSCVPWDGGAP